MNNAWRLCCTAVCVLTTLAGGSAQQTSASAPQSLRRIPERSPTNTASLNGQIRDQDGRGVAGVEVLIESTRKGTRYRAQTNAEGIFRLRDLRRGSYLVRLEKQGYAASKLSDLRLQIGEAVILELNMTFLDKAASKGQSGIPGSGATTPQQTVTSPYPGLHGPLPEGSTLAVETVPPDAAISSPHPDRWNIALPEWRRYERQGDVPYVKGRWYDPFNRNRLKGDYPIFGQQWFFQFTGTSTTAIDARRLPLPSGLDSVHSGSSQFFGRGEQAFLNQDIRLSFDLFRGDTSFRPVDFRVRFTPEVGLNFLQARERGIVDADPRFGTERFDTHAGVQEAFVEAKLHDLSPNFDFISIRAGIQQFNSDFRGFIFSEEQPGVRLFGNLHSNRINYNLAWFYFLEKNTNSGLNSFENRGQQVYLANVYVQDFLAKGYTTEFSFHFNRDNGGVHYDDNGFLVRPAPVGAVVNNGVKTHNIEAYYLGWASNGHIGRLNLSHALYQALGHDDFNAIAGRRVDINARMGAVELSLDRDWIRYRTSFFYASGDSSNRSGSSRTDGTARGFDTNVDDTHFAGTAFSFWDAEGIRLTGTGVALTNRLSLLPSLRSNKEEGQANFVNPGIYLFNLGADFDVTPKLRTFVNGNYLRFDRTEPLELLLFQRPIRHSIGTDFGAGFEYRPPLTENIVVRGGASALVPGQGLQDVFNKKALVSIFTTVKVQF